MKHYVACFAQTHAYTYSALLALVTKSKVVITALRTYPFGSSAAARATTHRRPVHAHRWPSTTLTHRTITARTKLAIAAATTTIHIHSVSIAKRGHRGCRRGAVLHERGHGISTSSGRYGSNCHGLAGIHRVALMLLVIRTATAAWNYDWALAVLGLLYIDFLAEEFVFCKVGRSIN